MTHGRHVIDDKRRGKRPRNCKEIDETDERQRGVLYVEGVTKGLLEIFYIFCIPLIKGTSFWKLPRDNGCSIF